MRVCFVVGTLGCGGAEKQLVFMLRAIKRAGIEARVLCLTEGEFHEAEIKSLGVEVEYIGGNQNRIIRLCKIIQNIRKQPADIIHSSHFYTNIYAALAGKILKLPSIGAIRSNLKSELAVHKSLGAFQISLPDFLIVNSELGRCAALEYGISPEKIEFVRNVVEAESGGRKIPVRQKNKVGFLFVGRLSKEKRPDRFLRLADALVRKYPELPLNFQIAGDGVMRKELEAQTQRNSLLKNKVEFLGERAEMKEIYRQADILVLTSDYEGTPNVVLEAMAHSIPVIATRVGGVPEILNERRGFLVEPDDAVALMKAACRLVESPELRLRLGGGGLKHVKSNHTLDILKNHLTEIYGGLAGRREKGVGPKPVSPRNVSHRPARRPVL